MTTTNQRRTMTNDIRQQINSILDDFTQQSQKNIENLSVRQMIDESKINPFLAKALGFKDFESLARFYVYQTIGRSVVTSFGSRMEKILRVILDGEKYDWWDIMKKYDDSTLYISVKSGPNDMNKDQTMEFSRRAKELMENDPTADPIIGMTYGKKAWNVIPNELGNQQLDPNKHMFVGKDLYHKVYKIENYHLEILASIADREQNIVSLIEDKIREISTGFENEYETMDDFIRDLF